MLYREESDGLLHHLVTNDVNIGPAPRVPVNVEIEYLPRACELHFRLCNLDCAQQMLFYGITPPTSYILSLDEVTATPSSAENFGDNWETVPGTLWWKQDLDVVRPKKIVFAGGSNGTLVVVGIMCNLAYRGLPADGVPRLSTEYCEMLSAHPLYFGCLTIPPAAAFGESSRVPAFEGTTTTATATAPAMEHPEPKKDQDQPTTIPSAPWFTDAVQWHVSTAPEKVELQLNGIVRLRVTKRLTQAVKDGLCGSYDATTDMARLWIGQLSRQPYQTVDWVTPLSV